MTKIPINPRRRASTRMLGNPHQVHSEVAFGIPGDPRAQRLLWRMEAHNPFRPVLLVLSETRPGYTEIVKNYGWPDTPDGAAVTKDYAPLLNRLEVGQEYRFRLTANPVQSKRHPDKLTEAQRKRQDVWDAQSGTASQRKVRGHRVAHRTAAHQRQWLIERAERYGFVIPRAEAPAPVLGFDDPAAIGEADFQVALVDRRRLQVRKNRNTAPIGLDSATFEGRLRIADLEKFRNALVHGIGPAKAYGQGLLTLAPLQPVEH